MAVQRPASRRLMSTRTAGRCGDGPITRMVRWPPCQSVSNASSIIRAGLWARRSTILWTAGSLPSISSAAGSRSVTESTPAWLSSSSSSLGSIPRSPAASSDRVARWAAAMRSSR